MTTHFRFAPAPGNQTQRRRARVVAEDDKPALELTYAPAASLWRVNHQWRRGHNEGFWLELTRGFWQSRSTARDNSPVGATQSEIRSNVRLFVRDTANALLLYPPEGEAFESDSFLGSLQHALARGIQAMFQVEEDELASERIGREDKRGILFWEAAEGGLGVLRRMVDEPDTFSQVASIALDILHFDPHTGDDRRPSNGAGGCTRACYDCLLSYYNQRDHEHLDRHCIRDFLLALAQGVTRVGGAERTYEEHYHWLRMLTDTRSELERRFLDHIFTTGRRLPEYAQRHLRDAASIPDFFYEPNVCIFCDGSVHDEPQQRAADEHLRRELKEYGYRVIAIRYDRDLEESVRQYQDIFSLSRAEGKA